MSIIQRLALPAAMLVLVVGSVPLFGQTPSTQLKQSATETRKNATIRADHTAAKARIHHHARTSGALPTSGTLPTYRRSFAPQEHSGAWFTCNEPPFPPECD